MPTELRSKNNTKNQYRRRKIISFNKTTKPRNSLKIQIKKGEKNELTKS